jgi:hexosaminidase
MIVSMITHAAAQQPINVIPQPVRVEQSAGSFTLTRETTIGFNKPECRAAAEMLAKRLNRPTGFALKPQERTTSPVQININDVPNPLLATEGYTLAVTPTNVVISANRFAGLYYGIQTLLQLLPKEIEGAKIAATAWTIPSVTITDYPRFAWRGIMLDVSRHFFTKDEVKRYIDQISKYKFNTFHWHLADDQGWRLEIKSRPRLTSVGAWRVKRYGRFGENAPPKPGEAATDGGFYTQDDVREIVQFAQERNVTIVPELDIPGHSMAAVAAYPELSCTKDTTVRVDPGMHIADWDAPDGLKMLFDNTLNPSDEKVYAFLGDVFSEVAALFPGKYIHVGGDECYKGYWAHDPGCSALMKKLNIGNIEGLQGYFMNRVEQILKTNGKKLIGWDEILEGGISPEATVMSWRGVKGGITAAKMGHDVVMSPTTFAYLDYNQGETTVDPPIYSKLRIKKCYSFEPVPEGVESKYILGGQGNLWTEHLPTIRSIEYMTYPRAWALSEVFWSPMAKKNWEAFVPRMEAHFGRADAGAVNCSHAVYDAIVTSAMKHDTVRVFLDAEIPGVNIYYTIDETMPDNLSPQYTETFDLPDGPITLRVVTYRNGTPIGHLITLKREDLAARAGR